MNHTDCIAANLRASRAKADKTKKSVAREVGVSTASLNNWEHGQFTPTILTAWKLADYYGVTLDELVGRKPVTN